MSWRLRFQKWTEYLCSTCRKRSSKKNASKQEEQNKLKEEVKQKVIQANKEHEARKGTIRENKINETADMIKVFPLLLGISIVIYLNSKIYNS